jgi:hypothetical protein
MKPTAQDAKARGVYGILFFVSLPIPLFHYRVLGDALWAVRYPWGLHPVENLLLWQLGRWSVTLPIAILALLAASWIWPRLCAPAVLVGIAIGVSVSATLYAFFCALALWMALPK